MINFTREELESYATQPDRTVDHLAAFALRLLDEREKYVEALRGLHYAHSQIVGGEVVHPNLNVPHLWDRVRACLPEYDKEEE